MRVTPRLLMVEPEMEMPEPAVSFDARVLGDVTLLRKLSESVMLLELKMREERVRPVNVGEEDVEMSWGKERVMLPV